MLVDINIVTYNNASTIQACLDAALGQTIPCTVQVYDNASEDDTVALVKACGVRIFEGTFNAGYASSHNYLLDQTNGKYVLTLNPDLVLEPDFCEQMVAVLDDTPGVGLAAGCLLRVDDLDETSALIDSAGVYMRRNRRQGLRHEFANPASIPKQNVDIFGPDGAAAFYRREMLVDIAYKGLAFDNDYFMHKEDIDVCWRAQLRGWKALFIPAAVGRHIRTFRPGLNVRKRASRRLRWIAVRNRYLLIMKNDTPRGFWEALPHLLRYDVLVLGYIVLREPSSLWAFVSLTWQFPRTMQKRRHIQQGKRVQWADIRGYFDVI
jgi:GT2 family glycosyltransferase